MNIAKEAIKMIGRGASAPVKNVGKKFVEAGEKNVKEAKNLGIAEAERRVNEHPGFFGFEAARVLANAGYIVDENNKAIPINSSPAAQAVLAEYTGSGLFKIGIDREGVVASPKRVSLGNFGSEREYLEYVEKNTDTRILSRKFWFGRPEESNQRSR